MTPKISAGSLYFLRGLSRGVGEGDVVDSLVLRAGHPSWPASAKEEMDR